MHKIRGVLNYEDLNNQPFLLLEHGGKTEVSELLEKNHAHPNVRFTTWEDYAIMAMVKRGLGIGILPEMILKRIPYQIAIRSFTSVLYRNKCQKWGNERDETVNGGKWREVPENQGIWRV